MKSIICAFLLSGLLITGCSNSSNSGKSVTFGTYDGNSDPVVSAEVKAGGKSCVTDDEGFCSIKLKTGQYDVTATKNGYEPYSDTITIDDNSDVFYFGLLMVPSAN